MRKILQESTPLSDKDCFYIVDRHKSEFTFPLHCHTECELNFIEKGQGVQRVVGDSIEYIGDYDLTLIAGKGLEHSWEQGRCVSPDVREVTIQFSRDILPEQLLTRTQFASIKEMLHKAELGLNFSLQTIMKVYDRLDSLSTEKDSFEQFLHFLKILYDLSRAEDSRTLASSTFAKVDERKASSRRIQKVKSYVAENYPGDIRLENCAAIAGMTPSAFSRFFKQHTGRTLMEYVIDTRLGVAARMLVDTTLSVSEICFACGFNNLSNFNRTFKSRRGYTPRDFRALFKKNKVFV